MYDIKCKRQSCEYNKNCNCTSKVINVKKDTTCDTYSPVEKTTIEEEKIGQPAIRKDIEVECNAKCLFSEDGICHANGITVQPSSIKESPICVSFQPK